MHTDLLTKIVVVTLIFWHYYVILFKNNNNNHSTLGALAKLRLASICLSVLPPLCVSVCPHGTTGLHWTDFHDILHLRIFRKCI